MASFKQKLARTVKSGLFLVYLSQSQACRHSTEPKKKKLDKCKGLQCTMLDKKEDENDIGKHLTASDFYKTGTSVLSKIFYWTTCSGLHDFLIFNCLPSPITPYCFLSLVSSVPWDQQNQHRFMIHHKHYRLIVAILEIWAKIKKKLIPNHKAY